MNYFKTFFLLTGLSALFIFIGNIFGGQQGMVMAFAFAVVMNMGSYWFSDKIVLKYYKAYPADEQQHAALYKIVRQLTEKENLPMPRVCIIPGETPNAFATGRNPQHAVVACTEGILRILNERELAGVIGHELGHVKNRDILIASIAATMAGAIMMLASMIRWAAIFGGGGRDSNNGGNYVGLVALLLTSILAPIAAVLIQSAVSRSREYAADRAGALSCGDPMALASALQKLETQAKALPMAKAGTATAHLFIVNPLTKKSIQNLFSTHPPTEERVARLKALTQGPR